MTTNRELKRPRSLTSAEQRFLDAWEFEGVTFDEIVHRSGLTPTEVSSILSALEVRGLVRSLGMLISKSSIRRILENSCPLTTYLGVCT